MFPEMSIIPRRVALLQGGESAEREVSLASGGAIAQALEALGHQVNRVDPAETPLADVDWRTFDLAFLALHGGAGEDGTVQAQLERLGVRYTGSGPQASRLAFSKIAAKQCFVQHAVPTAPWLVLTRDQSRDDQRRLAGQLGYPLVVKPDQQGSSLGVSVVQESALLEAALAQAFHYGPVVLLEQAIDGPEWTVGLLDLRPLPAIRIGTARGFFDYQAKYHSADTEYLFDDSSVEQRARIAETARDACAAIGTQGVGVDLMVDRLGRPFVLEVNTIPGFTDHSLVPKAAARAGLSFNQLCQWCLEGALQRSEGRRAA